MKIDDISCAYKLWFGTLGLMSGMLVLVTGAGVYITQANDRAVAQIDLYETHIHDATRWRGLVETNVQRVIAMNVSTEPLLVQTFDAPFKAGLAQTSALQKSIIDSSSTPAEKAAIEKVSGLRADLLGKTKSLGALKEAGDMAAVSAYLERAYLPGMKNYFESLQQFEALQVRLRDDARLQAAETRRTGLLWGGVAAALLLVLGGLLARSLVHTINRPLQRAVSFAQGIADGDLRGSSDSQRLDEFGLLERALSTMSSRLNHVVTAVHAGVGSVATASAEIAQGNFDLSSRTEQSAANLQETAASMEELTSTVSQSADRAAAANKLASSAADVAQRGGKVVNEVVTTMDNISQSSRKIADIIGVIDGIAFQTNILALNAAVEAARAGEQGRGFAVVAGEVRNLASRSAAAAREIKTLIGDSVTKVETGAKLVREAGSTMTDIVVSVESVRAIIDEISNAAREQRDGIAQVNTAVGMLDQLTQQNAALVEESAAASSSLRGQAHELEQVVAVFQV